ncbi:MAG TPA: class D sortase [Gammaproteobacteria bacterium]|nr:class D sortase [Gammaproteobacteria bacterium]
MLETACWTGGMLLIVLYFGARAYGEIERRQAVSSFAEARSVVQAEGGGTSEAGLIALDPTAGEPFPTDGVPDQTQWSASRIRAYAAVTAEGTPLPGALLRIRRVGLEVPVYADTNERNLNRGAGLIAGTGVPDSDGNIAIAAHRDGYFRVLERVVVGDVLELDSLSRQRRYRVTELAIVEPTDMSPLDETDAPALTLVTCYPFHFAGPAPQRYIVRALAID